MTKYDVALYGNLTIDEISIGDEGSYTQTGGIGNIERHLNKINPKLNIVLVPLKISYYHIYRTFAVEKMSYIPELITGCNTIWKHYNAIWKHLSYADECMWGGRTFNSVAFQKMHKIGIDSGEQINHAPDGSRCFRDGGTEICTVFHDPIANICTIGAGDMLVAEIINCKLQGKDIKDCLEKCHLNVRKELINRAKKL